MLIDFHLNLSAEERKRLEEQVELALTIKDTVKSLYDYHVANSKKWYPHTVVPWGQGQDFNVKAWDDSQASLRPEIRLALETNLLTEDNLPYYHEHLTRFLAKDETWAKWNRRWTAEEGKHAGAIRDYLYLTRNFDPILMEDNRQSIMETGFDRNFDPVSIFIYTCVQELATRVCHANTGRVSDDPILRDLLNHIATDENFHFVFYRGVVKAMLDVAPELVLPAMVKELYSFSMPGDGMGGFKERMEVIADQEIYGPRQHRDIVLKPLFKHLGIESLTGLSPEGQKMQEKVLRIIPLLDRVVDARDRKKQKSDPTQKLDLKHLLVSGAQ